MLHNIYVSVGILIDTNEFPCFFPILKRNFGQQFIFLLSELVRLVINRVTMKSHNRPTTTAKSIPVRTRYKWLTFQTK